MQKYFKITGIALFLIFALFSFGFSEEQITITTYYPAPYGSYNELETNRLYSKGDIDGDGAITFSDAIIISLIEVGVPQKDIWGDDIASSPTYLLRADVDGDGSVDWPDDARRIDQMVTGELPGGGRSSHYGYFFGVGNTPKTVLSSKATHPAAYSGYFEGGKGVRINGRAEIDAIYPTGELLVKNTTIPSGVHIYSPANPYLFLEIRHAGGESTLDARSKIIQTASSLLFKNIHSTQPWLPIFSFMNSSDVHLLDIKGNGNVGIGIESPQEKLHVNGNMKITNGTFILQGPTTSSPAYGGVSGPSSPFSYDCPEGYVVTGIRGREGINIEQLQVVCKKL